MRLDLLRHGQALAPAAGGDAQRPLSASGMEDLRRLGRRLAATGWSPNHVFASPLRRARDSAILLLESAGVNRGAETLDELDPSRGGAAEVLRALEDRCAGAGHVLLVGHQPLLGHLAETLCGSAIPFLPAGLASIECPGAPAAGTGRLTTLLVPGTDF